MQKGLKNKLKPFIIALCLILTGCGSIGLAESSAFDSNYENTQEEPENIYVSAADVMFKSVDQEQLIAEFYVLGTSDIVSLSYDGSTVITDRFGSPLSIVQLQPGDISKITYNSTLAKLGSITLSDSAFNYSGISKYEVNSGSMVIGDETYSINSNIHVFSAGGEISLDQLINHDEITVQGTGHEILSIRVDDGHGYLDLQNEEALVGGWIEIGQTVISQVMDGMLFTVPEGQYTVRLTNTGIEEYCEITIYRNQVTELDLGDIEAVAPEKGIVSFNIYPNTAVTYIDGSFVDTAYSIRLPIGMHEITVQASGYSTVTQFFEVTGIDQLVSIDLEKESEKSTTSVSNNTVNRNLYANMIIENPVDVEVYEDNIYKGISPVTYQKTTGTHTITFRRNGYATVSYTVVVEDDGRDMYLSFPDMIKDDSSSVSDNNLDKESSSSTVSNNSVSSNSL